jgi:hypothetical protein
MYAGFARTSMTSERKAILSHVTIRRCPVCQTTGARAKEVEAALRNDPDTTVNVVDGEKGQFTVEVDGKVVAGKTGDTPPSTDSVVRSVHEATPAAAGKA